MVLDATGAPYLLLQPGDRRCELANGPSWAIGRGDGCAVMLEGRSVSRLHALIQRREGGDYSLVDLGSRNGSFVNGRRVSVPVLLRDGDRLVFGDQESVFHNPVPSGTGTAEASTAREVPTTALHAHTLTTIAVVDIRDYTPLARSIPEGLLSQAIGTWFLRVGQIAGRMGSWAQRYIGDAVMAVWVHEEGAALDRDLRRVLRAVSEIDIATGELHKTLPLPGPLRVGAGINTGPAIVGGAEFTALGDTVNAAFRLEAATKQLGFGVALGERSFSELLVPGPCPFQRREVTLKGYDEPATAWAISFEDLNRFLKG
ncbi:MAG: adenylate/guanylate cyclase domain-containing protein [Bryobacteraceae bacterium]|jgi:adenylate cyclase